MAVILATKPLGSLCHTSIIKLARLRVSAVSCCVVLCSCLFGHYELTMLSRFRTVDSAPTNGGHWEELEVKEVEEKKEVGVKKRWRTQRRRR